MAENPTYGALKIQTLEDLMDAIAVEASQRGSWIDPVHSEAVR